MKNEMFLIFISFECRIFVIQRAWTLAKSLEGDYFELDSYENIVVAEYSAV